MKIWISDSSSAVVTCLQLESRVEGEAVEFVCLEGDLPSGLTMQDLAHLGIVTYEPDNRGRPIPKVSPIDPCENLEYLRALIEAMPPGYFVSRVESKKIDELRREKADKFHRELELLDSDEA